MYARMPTRRPGTQSLHPDDVLHPAERRHLLGAIAHLVAATPPDSATAVFLGHWLKTYAGELDLDLSKFPMSSLPPRRHFLGPPAARRAPSKSKAKKVQSLTDPRCWARLASHLARTCEKATPQTNSPLDINFSLLHQQVQIPEQDAQVFNLLYRLQADDRYQALVMPTLDDISGVLRVPDVLKILLGISRQELRKVLRRRSPLTQTGLLTSSNIFEPISEASDIDWVNHRIVYALQEPFANSLDLANFMLGDPVAPELEYGDFDHMADMRDFATRLLRGARESKQPGINVLLYGNTGTGKSQFCRVVAREAGMTLHEVRSNHGFAEQARGSFRLKELQLANSLLSGRSDSLIMFDEMEDIIESDLERMGNDSPVIESKAYFNTLLETHQTPILWTTNNIHDIDPAFLRRMTLIVEFRTPPRQARERIWKRTLARHGMSLPDDFVSRLSASHELSPGFVGNAVVAAKLTGDQQDVMTVLNSAARAMRARPLAALSESDDFDQSLVNCAQPVAELTSAMLRARDRNFSLCLYGPPGTGKSAYARYLAASLGMEVLVRRASDLLGMFLGQSEHNIAAMFAEAVDRKAFLIVDEADSLLRERGAANHSWEVTQVNEMLTWMEQHPLPYAFTTNLMDGLDRAAMRRFTFKARFDYLLPGQAIHAFRHFLHAEPPAEITRLDRLTPGDFRVVKARAEILEISDPQRLLNMLREEVALKRDGAARAIGFAPAVQQ